MNLLHTIVRCPNVEQCYSTGQSACCDIINLQRSVSVTISQHHVPEPWSGDIEHAPILFISSNPGFNKADIPHGEQAKFPLWEWPDEAIEEFFTQRFNQAKSKPWIKDNHYLLRNGSYSRLAVSYWSGVRARAKELLERDVKGGVDYALTEIVHCQSENEQSITDQIKDECVKHYLQPVLALSGAKVLVVMGDWARNAIEDTFRRELKGALGLSDGRVFGPLHISGRQRYIAFMPHTNARMKRTFKNCLDKETLQVLQAFLRKQ
jgi:hypothetical protein